MLISLILSTITKYLKRYLSTVISYIYTSGLKSIRTRVHISAYTTYCFKNVQLIQKQYKRYFLCACPQTMQDKFAISIFRCSLWTNLRFTVKVFIWGAWKHVRPPVAVSIVFEQELPMNVFIACSIFALYVAAPPLWHARGDVFRVYLGRLTFNPLTGGVIDQHEYVM